MKIFANNQAKAAAYATYKELERMLKEDGELPPGFKMDVSGIAVEVVLPQGTIISRDEGTKKDGKIFKTATQNLYGWAILYECFKVASLFKQHKRLEKLLLKIVRRAIRKAISSGDAFRQLMPKEAENIELLKRSMNLPKREESTPRNIERSEDEPFPTVIVTPKQRKAA